MTKITSLDMCAEDETEIPHNTRASREGATIAKAQNT